MESTERRKTSFRKEIVENADQHTPVLNKIMTNDLARIMRKIQSRSSFKYFHFKVFFFTNLLIHFQWLLIRLKHRLHHMRSG